MLAIATWLWGEKYSSDYVEKLADGIRRNLKQPHRFLCMTERDRDVSFSDGIERHAIEDPSLLGRGCFARLRMFDRDWQISHDIGLSGPEDGADEGWDDRLVCLDLDVVITGALDELFDRPEPFVILHGANSENSNPFNGSVMMLRAGANRDVWSDFSLEKAADIPYFAFPDDQAWLHHKIPDAAGWQCGPESGIYAFRKPGWPKGDALPADARIVAFPGWRDPSKFMQLEWVKEHWRA